MSRKNDSQFIKSVSITSSIQNDNESAADGKDDNNIENILSFELSGYQCKLVALKNNSSMPEVVEMTEGSRQYRYIKDEIVHFCLDGSWFALCKDSFAVSQVDPLKVSEHVDRKLLLNLTERELQIVQLVCLGLLTKQIAIQLSISEFTVSTYIKTIFNKLGVRSRAAMVYKFTELSK